MPAMWTVLAALNRPASTAESAAVKVVPSASCSFHFAHHDLPTLSLADEAYPLHLVGLRSALSRS